MTTKVLLWSGCQVKGPSLPQDFLSVGLMKDKFNRDHTSPMEREALVHSGKAWALCCVVHSFCSSLHMCGCQMSAKQLLVMCAICREEVNATPRPQTERNVLECTCACPLSSSPEDSEKETILVKHVALPRWDWRPNSPQLISCTSHSGLVWDATNISCFMLRRPRRGMSTFPTLWDVSFGW